MQGAVAETKISQLPTVYKIPETLLRDEVLQGHMSGRDKLKLHEVWLCEGNHISEGPLSTGFLLAGEWRGIRIILKYYKFRHKNSNKQIKQMLRLRTTTH